MAKVTGLGGIFYKVADPAATQKWYLETLGVGGEYGAMFAFKGDDPEGYALLSPFKVETDYFAPSEAAFMINLRVDDLDGMIADLEAKGVAILGRQDEDYGKFAWILDPDGVKVELFQQIGGAPVMSKFATFAALHVPGDPVVLYNIWDPGSAIAVAAAGAKALATGSHPVGDASGFGDAHQVPLDYVFANARRIIKAVDVPLSIDFEGAYSTDPDEGAANVAALKATGAVGCNFEDQVIGGAKMGEDGLHPLELQVRRIAAIRKAVGDDFFINARTDLLLKHKDTDDALIDEAIARGKAFADAGASGFFVPRIADPRHIERVVRDVPLPLNAIAFPGAPPKADWAAAGVARISHGPFPHKALMATLTEMAKAAIG